MNTNNSFLINKQNLAETKISRRDLAELTAEQVSFKIERYALTANNITYAVCGESLKYWNFFPADNAAWGIIPVWGFAEVVESKSDAVKIGERFYGYFPMSEFLIVQVGKQSAAGFADASEHRQELARVYNYYARAAADDPNFAAETADFIPIIKPLFTTSFLLYHFLKDADFFGAEQIALTSASSKTALALAWMLKQNKPADNKQIVGLTSSANVEFTDAAGYFDQVLAYDDLQNLPASQTAVIDFAGNAQLLRRAAELIGDKLKYISRVGITDWKADKSYADLPNVHGFFAPTHIENKYKEWGVEQTSNLINQALAKFIAATKAQIEIEYVSGFDQLNQLYLQMLGGNVNPKKGYIVKN